MAKARRWTFRDNYQKAIVDVMTSELMKNVSSEGPKPPAAAITKPKAKAGPKRKGAQAIKKSEQLQSKGHVLDPEEATAYRPLSARANYLSTDCPDLSFSSTELCREFARPNQTSFTKLKRAARHLKSHKRLLYNSPWGT